MTALRALLAAALLLVLAIPATAQTAEPVLLQPCTNTADAIVVKAGETVSPEVTTPVGVANDSSGTDVGTVVVDLSGLPVGARRTTTLTMTVDNLVADYDLVVDGDNPISSDNPEVYTVTNVGHCRAIDVNVEVFLGLPIDQIDLDVRVAA
jgi:hypothetical protein